MMQDADPATAAVAESSPLSLFLLLADEAVLEKIELKYNGVAESIAVRFSKDAMTWTDPGSSLRIERGVSGATLSFEPAVARAVTVTVTFRGPEFRVRELSLVPIPEGKVEARDMECTAIGEHSAVIRWKTTRPVKTELLYGFSADRLQSLESPSYELQTDHEVRLGNLLPGMDYFVWITLGESQAAGGGDSKPLMFRTRGTPYPFAWNPQHVLGRDTAFFRFSTNVTCAAWIEWREVGASSLETAVAKEDRAPTKFVALLGGLRPRTTYEYQILTRDSAARMTATPWFRFATVANNAAVGCTVVGTFNQLVDEQMVENTGPALPRITDGRNDYFTGMATSGDPGETDQWVVVDLRAPKSLTSVETVWRGNAYPRSFYVMVSKDNIDWSYPGFQIDAGSGADERSTRGDPLKRVAVEIDITTPVRYIMLFIPKGGSYFVRSPSWRFVQLAEVEAHEVWNRDTIPTTTGSNPGNGR